METANRQGDTNTWRWRRILHRAADVIREEGLKSLWFKILGETMYRRMALLERLLNEPIPEVTARLPVVVINLLGETELDEYFSFRPEADPSEIRRRFEAGQLCIVVRHEGRIITASWAATGRVWIDYLARDIRLAPDEVYIYESFTSPSFRGQNIAPARGMQSLLYFRDAGYRRVLAAVMPENRPAFRPLEKLGFHLLGVMGYLKVGPWRYGFCRVKRGALAPGESPATYDPPNWDGVPRKLDKKHYLNTFLGDLKRQAHLSLIRRWGGVPASGRVLKTDLFEEAMGPDAYLAQLSSEGAMVVGMDVSAVITSQARNRDYARQGHYLVADARCLPFASNTFGLVISPSTLDHFSDADDLGRSLCELARILEPGGRLIITLDNRQNIFDPLLRLVNRIGWVPYYLGRSYRVEELRAELEAAGFLVQETTAILHNPRLMAVAAVATARKLRWRPLTALVQRSLIAAQRLESTRWRYYTGSFVAAKAVRWTEEGTVVK